MEEKIKSWFTELVGTDFQFLAQREFLFIVGAALALLIILLIIRYRPGRRIRAFRGETGRVDISRHAIHELVRSACEQMPEVYKSSIKIKVRRKLSITVRIRLESKAYLRDTASFLQAHLKDSLENNLGIQKVGKIEILVTGIRNGSSPKVDLNESARKEKSEPQIDRPQKVESAPEPSEASPQPAVSHTEEEPTPKPDPEVVPDPSTQKKEVAAIVKPDPSAPPPEKNAESESEEKDAPHPESKKNGPTFFNKKKI